MNLHLTSSVLHVKSCLSDVKNIAEVLLVHVAESLDSQPSFCRSSWATQSVRHILGALIITADHIVSGGRIILFHRDIRDTDVQQAYPAEQVRSGRKHCRVQHRTGRKQLCQGLHS